MSEKYVVQMLQDKRRVSNVWLLNDPEMSGYRATDDQDIKVYPEPGEMAPVPWVAIIRNGEVISRMPAHSVQIDYFPTQEPKP